MTFFMEGRSEVAPQESVSGKLNEILKENDKLLMDGISNVEIRSTVQDRYYKWLSTRSQMAQKQQMDIG